MAKDFRLTLSDGFHIAGQSYIHHPVSNGGTGRSSRTHRILLIHGSMDNCRSYHLLGPALLKHYQESTSNDGCEIVAIDLPSHGQSDWRESATVVVVDYVPWIAQIITALEWDKRPVNLIAHSMGCMIASAYTASFPQYVSKLVLLEATGSMERHNAAELPSQVQAHVQARLQQLAAPVAIPSYGTIEEVTKIRQLTPQQAPGNQYISYEAARELVLWGTKKNEDGTYQWRLDPKLHVPHLFYLSLDQVLAISQSIKCPVCLLVGDDGWPIEQKNKYENIVGALQPVICETLPGSHAFHADPEHAPAVIDTVIKFLDTHYEAPDKKLKAASAKTVAKTKAMQSSASDAGGCCVIL